MKSLPQGKLQELMVTESKPQKGHYGFLEILQLVSLIPLRIVKDKNPIMGSNNIQHDIGMLDMKYTWHFKIYSH